jgi:hypothetical protein
LAIYRGEKCMTSNFNKCVQKCATKYQNVELKETDILLKKWKLS